MTGTERILNTPLPVAYNIAIAQITWVYVVLLPFQLYNSLKWVTIPGCIFAAYIILGIMFIGREIENPFGDDVNDLPLDQFCTQIAQDVDVIASMKKPDVMAFVKSDKNKVLFPISDSGYPMWERRSEKKIREELKSKVQLGVEVRQSMAVERPPQPQGEEKV
jgi:ion channel-forming bestrophin family protein